MGISFDNALGIHEPALQLRVQRASVLANNLANADTPGFKARDFDFQAVLRGEQQRNGLNLETTNTAHIDAGGGDGPEILYRNPIQPSLDGNTVDTQYETAEYLKNVTGFEASFRFLSNRFSGLVGAIRGE